MKQTLEMKQAAFRKLMQENGFEQTGATTYDGNPIYARTWRKVSPVVWYWAMESTYKIVAYESHGIPIIQLFDNDMAIGTRDYSSPKRAMNAIKEIIRCAGYVV